MRELAWKEAAVAAGFAAVKGVAVVECMAVAAAVIAVVNVPVAVDFAVHVVEGLVAAENYL